jgi:hypothetical protein
MTLQPCQNGSYWTNALTVSHVQEEFESSLTVEKCDYMDGCKCAIVNVIPEKARGRPFHTVYIYDTHTLLELGQRISIV